MKDQDVTKDTFENAAEGRAFVNAERHPWKLIDLTDADSVEFQIDSNGKRLWVNVDGKCAIRVQNCRHIAIVDDRPKTT